jgi:hypothetical protein
MPTHVVLRIRILGKTDDSRSTTVFMEAFLDKGRLSTVVKRIPVYLVLEEDMGQRGAHLNATLVAKKTPSPPMVSPNRYKWLGAGAVAGVVVSQLTRLAKL